MAKLERENVPFTQVANAVLNDQNISWGAKGLFSYLFSKPEDWDFSSERIERDGKKGEIVNGKKERSDGNKKSIQKMLKELEMNGYLTRKKQPDGRMNYKLRFSQQKPLSLKGTLGDEKPVSLKGSLPLSLSAFKGGISNKDTITNKDTTNNKEIIFLFEEKLQDMEKNTGSYLDVIATYIREKGIICENSKQLSNIINRWCRTAKLIEGAYTAKQVFDAIDFVKSESRRSEYDWGLETVYKKLTNK